jgi:hypothetical protein
MATAGISVSQGFMLKIDKLKELIDPPPLTPGDRGICHGVANQKKRRGIISSPNQNLFAIAVKSQGA